jgi:hypothetical protein
MKRDVCITRHRHPEYFSQKGPAGVALDKAKSWLKLTGLKHKIYAHDNCIIIQFRDGVDAGIFRMSMHL